MFDQVLACEFCQLLCLLLRCVWTDADKAWTLFCVSFLFACVAAAVRPEVRRSRVQVGDLEDDEPWPQARKLVFLSPHRLELPTAPALLAGPASARRVPGWTVPYRLIVCASRFVAVAESSVGTVKCLPLSRTYPEMNAKVNFLVH